MLRFDPFSDLDSLTRGLLTSQTGSNRVPRFMPMDLCKIDDHYVLTADLPGVDPGSVDVNVDNGTLTISAHRTARSDESAQWLANERFLRRLSPATLPRRRDRHQRDLGDLRERGVDGDHPGRREGQAAQGGDPARRRADVHLPHHRRRRLTPTEVTAVQPDSSGWTAQSRDYVNAAAASGRIAPRAGAPR